MYVHAYKTHIIQPHEDILMILDTHLPLLEERDIVFITSKIISLCEGRLVAKETVNKRALVQQEADAFLDHSQEFMLTIKNGLLIPAAGIDESNSQDDHYILYPQDIQQAATRIWEHLRRKHCIAELGVLITDSRTTPLRRGVTGVSLGWCGFEPLFDYIGKPDLFDKPLRVTVSNLLDGLAASAVLVMGEANEQTPLAIIKKAPKITFVDRAPSPEELSSLLIAMEEDIYAPLLQAVTWRKGF